MTETPKPAIKILRILLTLTGMTMIVVGLVLLFFNKDGTEKMFIVSLVLVLAGFTDLILSWFVFRKS